MWRRERAARRPDPGAPPPPPSHAHLDARMGGLRRSGVAVDAVPAAWKGIVFGFYGNEKCTWPFSAGDVAIFLPRVERALAVAGSLPPILVERKDVGLLLLDAPVEAAAGPLLFALREALHRTDRLLELLCILADDICAFLTDAERHNLDIALPDRMFDTLRGTRRRLVPRRQLDADRRRCMGDERLYRFFCDVRGAGLNPDYLEVHAVEFPQLQHLWDERVSRIATSTAQERQAELNAALPDPRLRKHGIARRYVHGMTLASVEEVVGMVRLREKMAEVELMDHVGDAERRLRSAVYEKDLTWDAALAEVAVFDWLSHEEAVQAAQSSLGQRYGRWGATWVRRNGRWLRAGLQDGAA